MNSIPTDIDRLLGSPDLYRDGQTIRSLAEAIRRTPHPPLSIMEVCGGQTFTLARYRLEELLPHDIRMIHGPGCPVCVTPQRVIDQAIMLAMRPEVILCSFGDMIRVPGTHSSLLRAKASGADVRILYSPLDTLAIAKENPERQVVFLAIGFETTTPIYAVMVEKALSAGIDNLSLLTSLYTVPAAVRAIKSDPECKVDALLAAGHVCAITGTSEYRNLAAELNMPVVITGFEPVDMMAGILKATEMAARGDNSVANAYSRVVSPEGNHVAADAVDRVFELADTEWRGIGVIPASGKKLKKEYQQFDARARFNLDRESNHDTDGCSGCIAHLIMKGLALPADCPYFAGECTPDNPVGAPMVSSEGVCAAHFRYRD